MNSIRYGKGCLALFVLTITMGPSLSAAQDGFTANAVDVMIGGADLTSSTPPLAIDEPYYVTFAEAFPLESDVFSDGARAGSRRSAAKAKKGKCAKRFKKTKDIIDAGPGGPTPNELAPVNEEVVCEMQYDNTSSLGGGPFPTTNVWMNISIPAGMQVPSFMHPAGATCYELPGRIDCNLPNVAAFAIEIVELTLVSVSPINVQLDFLVTQNEFDPDPSDNQIMIPFKFYEPGTISGTKFDDKNGNGIKDPGEPGVPGFEILINDVLVGSTDENGEYTCPFLPEGAYTVGENPLSLPGWVPSSTTTRTAEVFPFTITPDIDFGNYVPSDIIVWKFEDLNGNGEHDEGEPFLEGWEFWLDSNDDGVMDPSEQVVVTDGSGGADFTGLPPGTHVVRENIAPQTGWETSEARKEVMLESGQTIVSETAPELFFANYQPGDIIVWKYEDLNGNGEHDEGEPFLEGWEFWLDENDNGEIDGEEQSLTTDSQGGGEFTGLKPGTYVVRENIASQSGWGTSEARKEVELVSGQTLVSETAPELFFANYRAGDIIVYKFNDKNENGEKDDGEEFIEGWTVSVDGVEKTTDENGEARFEDLPPGMYDVAEVVQDGWENTTGNNPTTVELESGESIENETPEKVWFGNKAKGVVIVRKFHDRNGDGDRDDGEEFLEGWEMTVDGETKTTDSNGEARFEDFPPGMYGVSETEQDGWKPSIPNPSTVEVPPGETVTFDFGNYHPGEIHGTKYLDVNGDGNVDAPQDTPLAGWKITCSGGPSCTPAKSVFTDAAGRYWFVDLKPGTYTVTETVQAGWRATTPASIAGLVIVSTEDSSNRIEDQDFHNQPTGDPGDGADFGDAPEAEDPVRPEFPTGYPTLLANNGAVHVIDPEVRIGDLIDAELDGQPTIPADGDDEDVPLDDEDGIKFFSNFVMLSLKLDPGSEEETVVPGQITGTTGEIVVFPSTTGILDAWVDWNRDGDWADDGERIYDGEMVSPSSDTLDWPVPSNAGAGYTYARFRFTLGGATSYDGAEPIGEVEDYLLFTLAESTDIERIPDVELPNDYELFQNYPNPFNPVTNIRFAITNREWVTLEVYDILGKRVTTLVDGYVEAGEFTVAFDASELPSGIYIYRMTAGSFSMSKQLTLLK